jgi:hypothetical protein
LPGVIGVGTAVYSTGLLAVGQEPRVAVDGTVAGTGLGRHVDPVTTMFGGVDRSAQSDERPTVSS